MMKFGSFKLNNMMFLQLCSIPQLLTSRNILSFISLLCSNWPLISGPRVVVLIATRRNFETVVVLIFFYDIFSHQALAFCRFFSFHFVNAKGLLI